MRCCTKCGINTCAVLRIRTKMENKNKFQVLFIAGTIAGFLFGLCLALVLIKSIVCSP